jgi:hypothetical protein
MRVGPHVSASFLRRRRRPATLIQSDRRAHSGRKTRRDRCHRATGSRHTTAIGAIVSGLSRDRRDDIAMMARADDSAVAPQTLSTPATPVAPRDTWSDAHRGRWLMHAIFRELLKTFIAKLERPSTLAEGTVFELGLPSGLHSGDCRWRVRKIRPCLGISQALIEQVRVHAG